MVALPVWIESWSHQCCGERRTVGDAVTIRLASDNEIERSDDPHGIRALPDGSVRIVGSVVGQVGNQHNDSTAALVECGTVQFAAAGDVGLAASVCSTGKLWETEHGFGAGVTSGRLLDIRWWPAVLRRTGERESVIDGYADGRHLTCTDDWPRDSAETWALELSPWVRL